MIDKIVFSSVVWLTSLYISFSIGNQYQVKQCAIVVNEKVVSSSYDFCYYVNSTYGRSVKKRKAL